MRAAQSEARAVPGAGHRAYPSSSPAQRAYAQYAPAACAERYVFVSATYAHTTAVTAICGARYRHGAQEVTLRGAQERRYPLLRVMFVAL